MCKRKWWWAIWMWGVQVLLVNAFILYKTLHLFIWKREKKQVLSQYEFHCQVVLEWLCSSEEKEDSSTGDESNHKWKCNEASTSSSSKKGKRVNDATLDPISGDLCIHLDNDFHYPIVPDTKNKPCCSLCQWAQPNGNNRNEWVRGASVTSCDKCNVCLCVSCFKPFHMLPDVKTLKSQIAKNKTGNNIGWEGVGRGAKNGSHVACRVSQGRRDPNKHTEMSFMNETIIISTYLHKLN